MSERSEHNGIYLKFHQRLGEFELDIECEIPDRGITALFGPSGSGKTTVLRAIAGLEHFKGELRFRDEWWQRRLRFVPVHKRPIGYVFQEASLFPHLSVRDNLEFGLKRIKKTQQQLEFKQVGEWLGLEPLLERMPQTLSGGERQRVAIGRALLTSPELLLMDEPLSALDQKSKHEILPYLERLHDHLPIPVIYVSHSLSEVGRLADQLIWLKQGRIQEQGSAQSIMGQLAFAQEHGEEASAILETVVAGHDKKYHLTALDCRFGRLWVKPVRKKMWEKMRVRIPARDVSLSLKEGGQSSILNIWSARVEQITPAEEGQVLVRLGSSDKGEKQVLLARITAKSCDTLSLAPGVEVFARIKSVGVLEQ